MYLKNFHKVFCNCKTFRLVVLFCIVKNGYETFLIFSNFYVSKAGQFVFLKKLMSKSYSDIVL